ncbi:uncharacterized protein [Anabrus simplex]|uniref:uncharacterized protein n=1 Tax=Anabrus simplex TaxID=316456 RepID=UPI0035A3369A
MGTLFNQTSVSPTPELVLSGSTPASDVVGGVGLLPTPTPTIDEQEQIRIDFYRTYDVMTGVRIAATLGGFFSLMVLLVVYKSKCKSKSLSDEQLNAAAAEAVAQEDSQIAAATAAFYSTNVRSTPRRSVGNMSAPAMVLTRGMRQSSLGGYSSLEPPTCFYYQRGKSLPGSALRFHPSGDEFTSHHPDDSCREDEDEDKGEEDEEEDSVLADPCSYHQYLTVPGHSRRLSSITCSSSDTSYLERRGSAVELGLPAPPPYHARGSKLGQIMPEEPWDFYYPIDIQVIQPTPEVSPCGSERTLYHHPVERTGSIAESMSSLEVPRLAPLATISSCAGSLGDYPDIDMHSVGSDSVFLDDEDDLDTEDEVEGFSTDSEDEGYLRRSRRRRSSTLSPTGSPPPCVPYSQHLLQVPMPAYPRTFAPLGRWMGEYRPKRRLSAPGCARNTIKSPTPVAEKNIINSKKEEAEGCLPTSSRSCDCLDDALPIPLNKLARRPPLPLPTLSDDSTTSSESATLHGSPARTRAKLTNIPLQERASNSRLHCEENCSWSQETLF